MLDRMRVLELNQAGARHRHDGLAGRIRYEMEVKILHEIFCGTFCTGCLAELAQSGDKSQLIQSGRETPPGFHIRAGRSSSGGPIAAPL
jgi:hypothetical protein